MAQTTTDQNDESANDNPEQKAIAACRFCDEEFASWPDAMDHVVLNHASEVARRHKYSGLEVIEPANARSNGGQIST